MNDIEQVRLLLRQAFGDVKHDTITDDVKLTHEDCIELREDLCMLSDIDIQWYLPRVLEDIMDTYADDPRNAQFILMQLNITRWISKDRLRKRAEIYGKDYICKEKRANAWEYKYDRQRFRIFNREQACAIYEWLMLVPAWGSFTRYSEDDLTGAIEYWKKRASGIC